MVNYIPALRAFARSFCRTSEDADDLVQETLVKAIANCARFEAGTQLKSWLFTIMRNTFFTSYRKAKKEIVGLSDTMTDRLTIDPPQDWSVQAIDIQRALDRLPQHQRETIVLVIMLGESYETAAAICRCSVGTIKSRINRARRQLCRELSTSHDFAMPGAMTVASI
ncbi:RNA polymerase subunit sigma (plasmid) [Rhizobium sp. ACO-34A]|nr:RNA polymerase subunit sigma [Rhizobium sp. ACO-34A]